MKRLLFLLCILSVFACTSENPVYLNLPETRFQAKVAGDTVEVKVETNGSYTAIVDSAAAGWLSVQETGSLTAASIHVIAQKNTERSAREGKVTVSNETVSLSLTVTQQKGPRIAPDEAPVKEGYNVRGVVKENGTDIALDGVTVSDGYHCTVTDTLGCYYLNSDLTMHRPVFVVTPAEYENSFNSTDGLWNNWKTTYGSSSVSCNFALTPKKAAEVNSCRLLILGDPQRMSSRKHSISSWIDVCDKLAAYKNTVTGPLYQMLLGDLVVNEMEVSGKADDFKKVLATTGIRTYTLAGNHDHYQKATAYDNSIQYYAQYFGPYNYAFNLAGFHVVVLDNCNWSNKTYDESLNAQAITFLKEDMQYVPTGKPVIICMHCPMTKKYGGTVPSRGKSGYSALIAALKGRDAYFWYGHIHFGYYWKYTASELSQYANGVKSLYSNTVSRCGGNWANSGEVCRDGTPRGWVELDLNGTDAKWQFHSIETSYKDVMNVYYPGQFKGDTDENGNPITYKDDSALYCNVYLWNGSWTVPEFWCNGTKLGAFTQVTCSSYVAERDPYYSHLFYIWWEEGYEGTRYLQERPKEYDNGHLFKFVPPAGLKSGEIHVTDNWGREYTCPVNL